eukprot:jgi/Ulvmu1/12889/UM098_0077.1
MKNATHRSVFGTLHRDRKMNSAHSRRTYDVILVGARKQQDARLTLDEAGITFEDPHASQDPLIAHILWAFVFKIGRSSFASGTSDRMGYAVRMLDIVVRTATGLQDLRVACASRVAAEKLLSQFQIRIKVYCKEARAASLKNAASSPAFSRAGSFVSTHQSVLGQVQSLVSPDPASVLGPTSTATSAQCPSLDKQPISGHLDTLPAADTMIPDPSPGASGAQLIHASQRIIFLEEYISRLTAKLSELQQLNCSKSETNMASAAKVVIEEQNDVESAALKTRRLQLDPDEVQPLLVAYDATIGRLQARLQDRQDEVLRFEQRLEQISADNEGLLDKLRVALQEAATSAVADAIQPSAGHAGRLELLLRENSLLSKQNCQLDKEVDRLQAEQQSLSQRCLEATDNAHTASARLRAKEAEVDNISATLHALNLKSDELEAKLVDSDEVKCKMEAYAEEVLDLRQQVETLHVQRADALRCAEESAAAAAALHVDVDASREEAQVAAREAAAAVSACEELRATAASLRRTVGDYREKEAEVYASIQEAVEAAEQHKLARDAAKTREQQLHEEVASLQKQYAEAAAQLASNSSVQEMGAATQQADLACARRAVGQLETAVSDLQATVRRLEKEKRSMQALMDAAAGSEGCSAEALSNLRRALEAERECEAAKMQLEVERRSAQQVRVDEEIQMKKMEAQLHEASRQLSAWSASSAGSKHDVTLLTQQLDMTRRELEAVRTALARTNDLTGNTLASVKSEHISEVQLLAAKLEETMQAYNRSVAEAEHMMCAKEEILRKYKAEARSAAAKLHATHGTVKEKELLLVSLKEQIGSMDRERRKLRTDLHAAELVADEGKLARKQAAHATAELAELRGKHASESKRRRYAEMELERSKLVTTRARGVKPTSLIKST